MAEAWLNGRFLREGEPGLSLAERGFLLGEAAFETMRVIDGEIRRWPRHTARLRGGLGFFGLPEPDFEDIAAAASSLARRNAVIDGVVRLTVGGGPHGGGVARSSRAETTVLLTLKPRPTPPAAVRLALLDGARRGGLASERFKLAGYAECLAARRQAQASGADMAVLRGPDGRSPACADSANLFWIDAHDRVFTPALSTGALPGTTRGAVIEAAQAAGLGIEEASPGAQTLHAAVAACVTNAVIGVAPVSAIDGRALAPGHPLVQRLQQLEQSAL